MILFILQDLCGTISVIYIFCIASQGQAIILLPFFTSLREGSLENLKHILEKLIVCNFPMKSDEFPPDSLKYNNYVDCMKKVSFSVIGKTLVDFFFLCVILEGGMFLLIYTTGYTHTQKNKN